MFKTGLVFPGQGSQFVGMGKNLIENSSAAKDVFKKADSVLGISLSSIILEGPDDILKQTENAQPAILTASIAAWEALKEKREIDLTACICAGHSLGEYTALVAAQVLDFETALQLVRNRGRYMQEAAAVSDGSMAAVIGKTEAEVREICEQADEHQGVQIANLNSPGQIVISGSKKALAAFSSIALEQKIKVIPLAVSGPFHSTFMQSAREKLQTALNDIKLNKAVMPLIANVSSQILTEPEIIRESLVRQVTGSVRWEDSINTMISEGVTRIFEIGPGKVLRGLIKKINRDMPSFGVFEPEEILAIAEKI